MKRLAMIVDALDTLTGTPIPNVTTTPTFAWSDPKTGSADGYTVTLYTGDASTTTPTLVTVGSFLTTESSFRVPPGLLGAGTTYFAKVTAYRSPIDRTVTPFADALGYASADFLTAPFTP